MTLPFKVKSITIENTGFSNDGEAVVIVSIDETMCVIKEPVDCCVDSGMGYTMRVWETEFPWSFTGKDVSTNAYVLIQLQ